MADAKLQVTTGSVSFAGEGTEDWLSKQLDKVLEKLPELRELQGSDSDTEGGGSGESEEGGQKQKPKSQAGTLSAYLKEKKATSNQARKFLATAAWLQHGGMEHVTTAEVTKTLHTHKQGKLTNPSQCLNNNTSSGKIVKDGKRQFYVTWFMLLHS